MFFFMQITPFRVSVQYIARRNELVILRAHLEDAKKNYDLYEICQIIYFDILNVIEYYRKEKIIIS